MNGAVSPDQTAGVRPVVPVGAQSDWSMWGFFGVLVVGGFLLFSALNASDETEQVPSVLQPTNEPARQISSPAPLAVPKRFSDPAQPEPAASALPERPSRSLDLVVREPAALRLPPPVMRPIEPTPLPSLTLPASPPEPQVVFERSSASAAASQTVQQGEATARVTASRFLNPSLTIPQGTVIQAVLETALDSTRPGGVRALVQRDVSSFDGSRVLIPRGSRLYGEYEANLQRGQNRALVQWSRLIRPDGVTINLDSPSSDPLGRAGVKGKVDSKFLQRFGSAVLQSVVDLGINVAVSEATDGVILALPGSTQNVQVANPEAFLPTLRVKHGASVSVFVARDLDFSTVDS